MRRIKLLHLGDFHYPEVEEIKLADHKDDGISAKFVNAVTISPFRNVIRKIQDLIKDREPDIFLFSGDLTSSGDKASYQECVKFLKNAILSKVAKATFRIHVVVGNHDVDREAAKRGKQKFRQFTRAWDNHGFKNIVPLTKLRKTLFPKTGSEQALVISINSCEGCGEVRAYPKEIQNAVKKAFQTARKKPELLEQIDTPAVLGAVVNEVCREIEKAKTDTIPIILAHHNLLPQAIPRMAIYTELINGGLLRKRLSKLRRPVLYLHGHTHEYGFEGIFDPANPHGKLYCISAPRIDAGFNVIELFFTNKGEPLGFHVEKHRVDTTGDVTIEGIQRISFQNTKIAISSMTSRQVFLLRKLKLKQGTQICEWMNDFNKSPKNRKMLQNFSELALEADFRGYLTLNDLQDDQGSRTVTLKVKP